MDLPELNICLEVKFSKKPGNEKRIISEINDDIIA